MDTDCWNQGARWTCRRNLKNIDIIFVTIFFFFFFFISRLKTYRYHLHSTVPSIVKKDFRSPSLHYGWHSQLRLIFINKTKTRTTKPRYMTWQTTEQQSQGRLLVKGKRKEKKKNFFFSLFFSFFVFPLFPPSSSFFLLSYPSSWRFKTRKKFL